MGIYTSEYEKILEDKKKSRLDRVVGVIRVGNIMDEVYREIFKDKTTLYYFLRINIIRGNMVSDKLNIYKRYYKNGFLACSFTERYLMKSINITKYKVRKWINELIESGVIRKERGWIKDKNSPSIFILGTWQYIDGSVNERYYLDDVLEDVG